MKVRGDRTIMETVVTTKCLHREESLTCRDLTNVQRRVRMPSPLLSSLTNLNTRNKRKNVMDTFACSPFPPPLPPPAPPPPPPPPPWRKCTLKKIQNNLCTKRKLLRNKTNVKLGNKTLGARFSPLHGLLLLPLPG